MVPLPCIRRVAIVLKIREKSGNIKKGKNSQGKVKEFEGKKWKIRETSGNFDRLSEPKSSTSGST